MPKIELTFDEMITLAAACQQTAESLEHFPDLAAEYKAMRDVIHERFAAAETQERFEERCRQYGLLPDDKLPGTIYAPDPEDFDAPQLHYSGR